jgi:hypothetical protein
MIFDNLPSALPFIKETAWCPSWWPHAARGRAPCPPSRKWAGAGEPHGLLRHRGPKGLPKEVVDKVNAAVRKALEDPAVKKRIEDTGSIVVGNTPEQFAEQIKAEFSVYKGGGQQKLTLD